MSPGLGQPVLVENKSGAAGVTGVDFVAKAGSDAHVMGLMSASAGAIMQSLMPKMPFDPAKDIAPQILVVRVQEVFAVSSQARHQRPQELHRPRQGQSRQDHLRLGRHRRHHPSRHRTVQARDRHRPAARALSRRGAGHQRSAGRHGRHGAARHLGAAAACPLGHRQDPGRDLRHPAAIAARRADHARAGFPQGQFRQLVCPDLAGRGEPGGAQEDLRCRQCRAQDQGAGRRLCQRSAASWAAAHRRS